MADILQIKELLKGYKVDKTNIQSVGNMTVVPIVSDSEFTNVANMNDVVLKRDVSYDKLEFKNNSGHIGIAIQGWTMIDNKQAAQDRTIPYAHLIKAANAKLIPANCVQAHQPGNFDVSRVDQNSFMILPPSLRGIALKTKENSYQGTNLGALWEPLGKWVKKIDCHGSGLTYFYSQFESRLDQFVAQFEPVDKQLGAIVLINGQVVAIDLVPKYDTWKQVWRALIRDSYGAEALRAIENEGAVVTHPAIDASKVKTMDDLDKCFDDMTNEFYNDVQGMISNVTQQSVGFKTLEQIDELSMLKLDNEQFVGQGVLHGADHFVYLSLVNASAKPIAERKRFQSLRTQPYGTSDFSFN